MIVIMMLAKIIFVSINGANNMKYLVAKLCTIFESVNDLFRFTSNSSDLVSFNLSCLPVDDF